ncbi:hypothetical protein IFM89_005317 [Coptis chinensis]|uniref:K Homology domain-containing protein n=1 Tax=Coptis chinensis TaxID=261450 RepID=A0A835H9M0_9MAGN|nr:hypothetical protein IFM89_005317 [Coptis chinensis]
MNAVLREFKRIIGLSKTKGEGTGSSAATCSILLLLASSQAINLIGKQGSQIKAIQESSGASVRVLSGDEVPHYATSDERVVEIQGESLKVLKALEAVIGHLRKFLVDHSIIPLFEKVVSFSKLPLFSSLHFVIIQLFLKNVQQKLGLIKQSLVQTASQATSQAGIISDYPLLIKRDSVFLGCDTQLESQMHHSSLGHDPVLSVLRTSGLSRASSAIISQLTQTMQIPLAYAEDFIGIGVANIGYIRRTSGAILTVQESRGLPDEITMEIKGTTSQVKTAQQLIQDFLAGHKDPVSNRYGKMDTGLRSYSQLGGTSTLHHPWQHKDLGVMDLLAWEGTAALGSKEAL